MFNVSVVNMSHLNLLQSGDTNSENESLTLIILFWIHVSTLSTLDSLCNVYEH